MASSVASAAAWNRLVIASGASMRTVLTGSPWRTVLPVENAMKMSPLPLLPIPPTQAKPVVARLARR